MMSDFGMADYCLEKLSAVSLTQKSASCSLKKQKLNLDWPRTPPN